MNALIIFATEPLRLATFYAAVLSGSVTNSSEHLIDVHGPNSRVTILRMSGSSDNQGDVPLAREEVALKPVHALGAALSNPDPAAAQRAFEAMMQMRKIVIADLG